MDFSLSTFIRDPLYRLATWIIILQLLLICGAACVAVMVRWIKPKLEAKRHRGESIARGVLLNFLSHREQVLEENEALELFDEVSIRAVITAFEQVVTRIGEVEQRRLRSSLIALGIETHALNLTRSWWWWRRLEGALLLRSVGAETSEVRLVEMLSDPHPSVSFYAAWALARVSPITGLRELIPYIETEGVQQLKKSSLKRVMEVRLSFSQQVTLLKELQLELLPERELEDLFERLSPTLKPVMIEALIQSGRGSALSIVRLGISSSDGEVRISSFKAAAISKLSLDEHEIKQGLIDPLWPVRAQAVKVVAARKLINLVPELCQCLTDEQWWVRHNSAQALVHLGSSGVEALSYVSSFSTDRFARDMSRLVLSEAIMTSDHEVMGALDTQRLSPLPHVKSGDNESTRFDPASRSSLLTAELTAIIPQDS